MSGGTKRCRGTRAIALHHGFAQLGAARVAPRSRASGRRSARTRRSRFSASGILRRAADRRHEQRGGQQAAQQVHGARHDATVALAPIIRFPARVSIAAHVAAPRLPRRGGFDAMLEVRAAVRRLRDRSVRRRPVAAAVRRRVRGARARVLRTSGARAARAATSPPRSSSRSRAASGRRSRT